MGHSVGLVRNSQVSDHHVKLKELPVNAQPMEVASSLNKFFLPPSSTPEEKGELKKNSSSSWPKNSNQTQSNLQLPPKKSSEFNKLSWIEWNDE